MRAPNASSESMIVRYVGHRGAFAVPTVRSWQSCAMMGDADPRARVQPDYPDPENFMSKAGGTKREDDQQNESDAG